LKLSDVLPETQTCGCSPEFRDLRRIARTEKSIVNYKQRVGRDVGREVGEKNRGHFLSKGNAWGPQIEMKSASTRQLRYGGQVMDVFDLDLPISE
jgi:hypothetical protein